MINIRTRAKAEDGFTLIELMVVVLILGILMAIAIPTFLSLTNSAKANAAEANLTTALTAENAAYLTNGQYLDNAGLTKIEPNIPMGLPQASSPNQIYAYPGVFNNKDSIGMAASDGKQCYFIFDVAISTTAQQPAGTYFARGPVGGGGYCTNFTSPDGAPTPGNANSGTPLTWYTSF